MRILVITRNAWNDRNSVGNTLSNLFNNMSSAEFANIYFRASYPNNNVCKTYFHVSEIDIIKNWFKKEKIGESFDCFSQSKAPVSYEKKIISFIHKTKNHSIYELSDLLWYGEKWINENFINFVHDFKPDVVFAFAKSDPQYFLSLKYLHENMNLPIVLWIADDEYTILNKSHKKRDKRKLKNLRYILGISNKVFGCTKEICEYYDKTFGCNSEILYKNFSTINHVKQKFETPIKIVYAGNLLYGRIETINQVVDAIFKINRTKKMFSFDIYSSTQLTKNEEDKLNITNVSTFHGEVSSDEVKKIMQNADILLHVESFDKSEIIKTKYSLSTKIIDCLSSGNVTMAIGPNSIASMTFLEKVPGAITVTSLDDIYVTLNGIAKSTDKLSFNALDTANYCKHAVQNESPLEKYFNCNF